MLSKDWYRTSIAVIYVWQQTSCTTGINESIMVSKYKNKQFWYHLNSNFGLVTFVSYLYPQKLVNSEDQKILLVNFQWFILSINKEKYIKESNYLPFWIVISFHSQILFTLKFSRTTVLGKVNICLIGLRLQFEAVLMAGLTNRRTFGGTWGHCTIPFTWPEDSHAHNGPFGQLFIGQRLIYQIIANELILICIVFKKLK